MSDLAELLEDCDTRGIRLYPASDGGLTIDAPQAALTPDMMARLKTHKAELLALFWPAAAIQAQPMPTTKPTTNPVCRCGGAALRDVPIHDGQSVRRDCARCGRFIEFPVWYGETTEHNGQHPIE